MVSIVAGLSGLFMATALAAQQPAEAPPAPATAPAPAPALDVPLRAAPPPPAIEADNIWNLDLSTGGRVVIQLRPDMAPTTADRIKTLTRQGFYNGLAFFRVIEGFMAQGGDPQNNGTGGSPLPNLNSEINGMLHVRGAVAMARAQDPNSANSQFYIMFVPRLQMDRGYTVFGRVISGMNYVDAIERGEPPSAPSRIVRASLGSENLPPLTAEQIQAENARFTAAAAPTSASGLTIQGPALPRPGSTRAPEPVRAPGAPPQRPRPPQ